MRADLHMHSTASDGLMDPGDLMTACAQADLQRVALTDHDTLDGLVEAGQAALALGVDLLGGVELGLDDDLELHLLGYGVLPIEGAFSLFLREAQEQRRQRVVQILEKLQGMGMPLAFADVAGRTKGVLARPHVALAMVEAGYVGSVHVAFAKYLGPGKPAFVPREKKTIRQGVQLLLSAGAVPVLAHPGRLRMQERILAQRVGEWAEQGLMGLEVYHPSHTPGTQRFLADLARRHHLLITGGSDYHAKAVRDISIGQMIPAWTSIEADVEALQKAVIACNERAMRRQGTAVHEEE